jgi:hypothetical protein
MRSVVILVIGLVALCALVADETWDLAPFMFAAGFTHSLWTEAVYKPALEGIDCVHCCRNLATWVLHRIRC